MWSFWLDEYHKELVLTDYTEYYRLSTRHKFVVSGFKKYSVQFKRDSTLTISDVPFPLDVQQEAYELWMKEAASIKVVKERTAK